MNLKKIIPVLLFVFFGILVAAGCRREDKVSETVREAVIEPDYAGVTVPHNIAPMNFLIKEEGRSFRVVASNKSGFSLSVSSSDGIIHFPLRKWKKLLENSGEGKIEIRIISENEGKFFKSFHPIYLTVAKEPIDPYLCYRLLYPGYETYSQIKIIERNIESFKEKSIVENQMIENNCVNCHSFNKNDPQRFLLHIRGSVGGTYFVNGKKIIKTVLQTKEMTSGAVYPAWHPSGRLVAFSSNNIVQSFHSIADKNIEVIDLASSLVIYDTDRNVIMPVTDTDTAKYLETFPEWSPDGKYLYYCRANQITDNNDFKSIKYILVRKSFDEQSMSFGKTEIIYNAASSGKSVSFPRISPDGKYLIFTLHNYGNFSIWHKEADLYLLDLSDGKSGKMSVNSDESESYHSWSSNGKWIVFSSKRGDGLTARPYLAYFGSPDLIGKPFVLPQKDPTLYGRLVKTFNKPEFVTGKIKVGPREFENASKGDALKALWSEKNK